MKLRNTFILVLLFATACKNKSDKTFYNSNLDNCIKYVSNNKDSFYHYYNLMANENISNTNSQGYSLLTAGLYQFANHGAKEAIPLYTNAKREFAVQNNLNLLHQTNSCLAFAYNKIGKFDSAILVANDAAFYYDSIKNNNKLLSAYANLIQTYQVKQDLNNARKYIDLSLNLAKKNTKYYLNAKHTIANIYGMTGKFDSAMLIDFECLQNIKKDKILDFNISSFYDNLAQCHLFLSHFDSAEHYFQKSIYEDSIDNNVNLLADTYSILVGLAVRNKNKMQLQQIVNRALASADKTDYLPGKILVYSELYNKAVIDKNVKDQLVYKDSMYIIQNRIINKETENRIAELNVLHQTKYKDLTINTQKQTIGKSSIIIAVLAAAMLLSILALYFLKKWNAQKLQHEMQLEKEKSLLEIFDAEQNERIRIGRDLHDSIGQKLAVTKMYFEQNDNIKKGVDLLNTSIHELREISHNLIPDALNFGLISAIHQLHKQTNNLQNINFTLKQENEFILTNNLNKDLHTYRIYQELIANMIKHSHARNIETTIAANKDFVTIKIIYDGSIFNHADIEKSKGIGLKNIFSRLNLINGTIQFDTIGNKNITTIQLEKND